MIPQDDKSGTEQNLQRLAAHVADRLYTSYGQGKAMGQSAPDKKSPHFFVMRHFGQEIDLLIIFNTRRCRYSCAFCMLPNKSTRDLVSDLNIVEQFTGTLEAVRHAVGVIERVTLSNEGSVLDEFTFGSVALDAICAGVSRLKRVRRVEIETRMEFVTANRLRQLGEIVGRQVGILTGFETIDSRIRDMVLGKREDLATFLQGMDAIAKSGQRNMTAYVLFKPDWTMSDAGARDEAMASIDFLIEQSRQRCIDLTVRLNPMYVAPGTRWAKLAGSSFVPPRLTDVLDIGQATRARGINVYIGLSTEGVPDIAGTFRSREDFSRHTLISAVEFNRQGSSKHLSSPRV
jgi:radical SAM enzyme (TIGR01210 family)